MSDFPILVERLSPKQAAALGCASCGAERQATERECLEFYIPPGCTSCGMEAVMDWKYMEGEKCKGCGKLGFWSNNGPLKGVCSRKCQLQAEYAEELRRAS